MTSTARIDEPINTSPASATLFLVPPTVERTSEGRRLAAPLVGAAPRDQTLALRGAHPDVIELVPDEGKERLGIERVREVLRSLQYAPVQGERKVCLLPVAEGLTTEAANALLKILEEPPPHVAFVLVASHSGDLLPTIVSRSRVVRVPPRSAIQTEESLSTAGYSPEEMRWIQGLSLRIGDLDRLVANPVDATTERDQAAAAAGDLGIIDVLSLAISEGDPIVRSSALTELVLRSAEKSSELVSLGVGFLAGQRRETLFLFIQELYTAAFHIARAAAIGDVPLSTTEAAILQRVPTHRLLAFCSRCSDSNRALLTHSPLEAIFLCLFTCLEGPTNEQ